MKVFSKGENYTLYHGNSLDMLEVLKPKTIDSIITDPPYGLTSINKRFGKENSKENQFGKDGSFQRLTKGFMGKQWDGSGIEYNVELWEKCYEVLKPGGYLLAFGGSRTFHRIACAIEDAGFEIRDTIMWLYGSGFPKSMNVGLTIDKKNGCENRGHRIAVANRFHPDGTLEPNGDTLSKYEAKTEIGKQWQGWGTALKPAFEPIIVARKPIEKSIADNVLKYGVGGINIDECRVGNTNADTYDLEKRQVSKATGSDDDGHFLDQLHNQDAKHGVIEQGRFPSNVILTYDDSDFDEVCGGFPEGNKNGSISKPYKMNNQVYGDYGYCNTWNAYDDSGSASRYFYCAKASKKDRDEGLDIEIEEYVLKENTPKEIEELILNSLTS